MKKFADFLQFYVDCNQRLPIPVMQEWISILKDEDEKNAGSSDPDFEDDDSEEEFDWEEDRAELLQVAQAYVSRCEDLSPRGAAHLIWMIIHMEFPNLDYIDMGSMLDELYQYITTPHGGLPSWYVFDSAISPTVDRFVDILLVEEPFWSNGSRSVFSEKVLFEYMSHHFREVWSEDQISSAARILRSFRESEDGSREIVLVHEDQDKYISMVESVWEALASQEQEQEQVDPGSIDSIEKFYRGQ